MLDPQDESRPKEPLTPGVAAGRAARIIMIEKQFEVGGHVYSWAAVRAKRSIRWWLAGQNVPTRAGMSWEELLVHIYDRAYNVRIWAITELVELTEKGPEV